MRKARMNGTAVEPHEVVASDVGARIRSARKARGWSVAQLAGDDISEGSLRAIERERRRPSLDVLAPLAERLGVPLAHFIADSDRARSIAAGFQLTRIEDMLRRQRAADALTSLAHMEPPLHYRARALWLQGWISIEQGEPERALPVLQEAVDQAESDGDTDVRMRARFTLGSALFSLSRYEEAGFQFREAHAAALHLADDLYLGKATTALGHLALAARDFDGAMRLYRRARDLFTAVSDLENLAAVYTGMSRVWERLGDVRKALKYSRLALHVYQSKRNTRWAAHELNNIAARYRQLGELDEALESGNQALAWTIESEWRAEETLTRSTLAAIELDRGNIGAARLHAETAVERAANEHDEGRIDAMLVLASLEMREGRFNLAEMLYLEVLTALRETANHARYADAALAYSLALRGRGDLATALHYAHEAARANFRR
jgi:tetratricopeptide (TPR) repeat protein